MIQLSELLHLNIFDRFNLIAGEEGLTKIISNVVILEYESIENNYNDFNKGDFVLTSLFFAKDHIDYIYDAFQHLMERDVSGIGVKTVYFKELPPACIRLAEERNIPVFLFSDVYMEDIVINVYDYIKSKQRYYYHEEKIQKLLNTSLTPPEVLSHAKELSTDLGANTATLYLLRKEPEGENQIFRTFNQLQYQRGKNPTLPPYFLAKYKKGFLLIYYYDKAPIYSQAEKALSYLLNSLYIDREQYYTGICDTYHPLDQLDLSIRKSIYSALTARFTGVPEMLSSALGLYHFLLPLTENKSAMEYYHTLMDKLNRHDTENHSDLTGTLRTLNRYNWDIKAASMEMFQHQNTIRYRLSKAKTLLNTPSDILFTQLINTLLFLEEWQFVI